MDSSPPMLQVYRDDEHASVAAPLLPINNNAQTSQPRWSKQSRSKKHLVRAAFAAGAFVATYLVLCTWVAFSDNGSSLAQRGASTGFPHPKLPWPFPGRKHPHPHPHPHPHHRPHPIVLGCTAIPTPSADAVEMSSAIELNVTLPAHAPVILAETLIHGNVSVVKKAPSEKEVMMHEGGDKTLLVGIKVHNRTFRHPPPPPPPSEDGDDEEEEEESGPESFLLCAITFPGHPPHPPPPYPSPDMETDGQASLEHPHHSPPHGHPPFHPHHPPVIVAVLPALNETYPKFPGPHGPPHHPPPHHPPHGPPKGPEEESTTTVVASTDSVLITAWKSTISFLFPMLSIFPSTPSTFPGHHGPPCHHRPHPPPPPPPPPPFFVTALEVSLPRWTRVVYGHGPPPPHGPWRH